MRNKLKLWLPVLVWMGVIFAFSSMEINKQVEFNWWDFVIKKTAHVVEYAVLYYLLWRAMSNQGKKLSKKVRVWALLICIVYALSDEWHQTLVPGREGTLRDVGFDTIGALISMNWIRRQT